MKAKHRPRPSEEHDAYWVRAWAPGEDELTRQLDLHTDGVRTGKWLVFVPVQETDEWWEKIATATEQGLLGPCAKAGTTRPNPNQVSATLNLICVYTRDWEDQADVGRVLAVLRDLGVTWRLSYKTDDATLSGRYGPGSAVYVSQPGTLTFDNRTGAVR